MAFSLVSSVGESLGANGGTTSAIDTTGANLLVFVVSWFGAGAVTISDSKSNAWTGLTKRAGSNDNCRIYYVESPTVGSGHTFTVSGSSVFASGIARAFSGAVASSAFDAENGNGGTGLTSIATNSVTPAGNDELFIAGWSAGNAASSLAINSGFTNTYVAVVGGTSLNGAGAYKIQTAGSAENPTFSWSGSTNASAALAAFISASGGGGTNRRRRFFMGCAA